MRSLHQGMIEQLILTKEFHNFRKLDPKSLNLFLQYFLKVCCINKVLLLVLMLLIVLSLTAANHRSVTRQNWTKTRPKPH